MKKEIFYISNIISFSRFILLAVCLFFLINDNYLLTCVMIAVIWLSDLADGYVARRRNEISELGKIIDPIADKAVIITLVIFLLIEQKIPTYYVIITILRDALILGGGLYLNYKKNIVLQSNWLGKIAVFTIGSTLLLSIVKSAAAAGEFGSFLLYHSEITELLYSIMFFISIAMIVLSLISYFYRFLQTK
ncbi:MAG: phosphatidylglycerophosphate synthase [Chlorobi bacterium OLB5]|nr:MAG: phosphatidylglycerophosphate synthase [Chlorobi bacterium OLB5]